MQACPPRGQVVRIFARFAGSWKNASGLAKNSVFVGGDSGTLFRDPTLQRPKLPVRETKCNCMDMGHCWVRVGLYVILMVAGVLQPVGIDGLMQERRNSSALAMELRLSCINLSIWEHSSLLGDKLPNVLHAMDSKMVFCQNHPTSAVLHYMTIMEM